MRNVPKLWLATQGPSKQTSAVLRYLASSLCIHAPLDALYDANGAIYLRYQYLIFEVGALSAANAMTKMGGHLPPEEAQGEWAWSSMGKVLLFVELSQTGDFVGVHDGFPPKEQK